MTNEGKTVTRKFGVSLVAVTACLSLFASASAPAAAIGASDVASDSAIEAVSDVEKLTDETVSETASPSDLPHSADDAVTFTNLPLSISVVTDSTEQADTSDGLAVFPATSEGVSTVVQPTATGARLLSVHDGPGADMTQQYQIDLEPGAILHKLDDGSVVVVKDGAPVGGIDQPWAVGADGQPVATELTLQGTRLTQVIKPAADTEFPVVADPLLYGNQMNSAEFSFCKWPSRWSICNTAFQDSNTAGAAAKNLFPKTLHNGRGDAFRHCYWSALMTIHMGRATAAEFGDRHEESPGQPNIEYVMDQRNNAIGRDHVGRYTSSPSIALSNCRARAKDAKLWWIVNGKLV